MLTGWRVLDLRQIDWLNEDFNYLSREIEYHWHVLTREVYDILRRALSVVMNGTSVRQS